MEMHAFVLYPYRALAFACKANVFFTYIHLTCNPNTCTKAKSLQRKALPNAAIEVVQNNYKRLKKMVDANAEFPDTEKGKAAVALQPVIKRAGKLYNEKKGHVSASVENLLAELAKPEFTAHIVTLGVVPEAEALRAAKTAYDDVSVKRLDAKSDLRQTDSATIGRKKLEKALRNYLAFVTAMRGVEGWEDLYSDLNEVMKAARLSVRQGKEPAIITDEESAV